MGHVSHRIGGGEVRVRVIHIVWCKGSHTSYFSVEEFLSQVNHPFIVFLVDQSCFLLMSTNNIAFITSLHVLPQIPLIHHLNAVVDIFEPKTWSLLPYITTDLSYSKTNRQRKALQASLKVIRGLEILPHRGFTAHIRQISYSDIQEVE